jgi:N-methylhydantoinase A
MTAQKTLRAAVDIGGTFTDIVVRDADGTTRTHKVLSTPENPSWGMLRGIDELDIAEQLHFLVHGTTAGLNALLSRSGERLAFITTAGFKDVLEIGRGGNTRIWSLNPSKTQPLVDANDIRTVRERVGFDGSIDIALDIDQVTAIAQWVRREDISTVAVCLLHAHVNPVHERLIKRLFADIAPSVAVVTSHKVSPELGEYERASTTVATGYVARTVDRYLTTLIRELGNRGCTAPLHVMRSSGGICNARLVAQNPIQTILSGPAGGVVAMETLAAALDRPNLVGVDMGGTSSDVSMVIDGQSTLGAEGTIGDHTLRMPIVELHTIGAGGGSIARAEAGGLRVGPKSAGADPGPVCYGRGGLEPTVTDAQVFLGRIAADAFLGGRMTLDLAAAKNAMARLGGQIGLDAIGAAEGVLTVANALMANAIRTLALRRGVDPRSFSLVAFGGAGPLHGAAVADELGIEEVLVPFSTGVLSAWGMLHADIRHDVSAAVTGRASDSQATTRLHQTLTQLRNDGDELLGEEGVPKTDRSFTPSVDMRYVGQEHTINVEVPTDGELQSAFHDTYEHRYGHAMPGAEVEFVNARIAAIGRIGTPPHDVTADPDVSHRTEVRTIHLDGQALHAKFIDREAVGTEPVPGPAIIQEAGSTTLVPPSWNATRGALGTLILKKARA